MTPEELGKKYLGKRVAVYSYEEREKARVISVTEEGFLRVVFDGGTKLSVHPKQVRLLKKKERLRIWVEINGVGNPVDVSTVEFYPKSKTSVVKQFIEVKK